MAPELNPQPTANRDEWPDWAREHFPTTKDQAASWQPLIVRHALAMHVLTVATTRIEGMWCAYCNAVPGYDHTAEQQEVLRHGEKLSEVLARALFPEFEKIPYAH